MSMGGKAKSDQELTSSDKSPMRIIGVELLSRISNHRSFSHSFLITLGNYPRMVDVCLEDDKPASMFAILESDSVNELSLTLLCIQIKA